MKKETKKAQIGIIGENLAKKFLINKRYEILGKNIRAKFGEIDILGRAPDGMLVFIEVKAISLNERSLLKPEDNFTTQKSRLVNRMAQFFAASHPELLVDEERGWRIDLIAIEISLNGEHTIRHYENV